MSQSRHITYHSTPLRFLHFFQPTLVHLHPTNTTTSTPTSDDYHPDGSSVFYNSRKARKGRYNLHATHVHHAGLAAHFRRSTSIEQPTAEEEGERHSDSWLGSPHIRVSGKGGESKFKPHLIVDVSFWIAVMFTLGSCVWVVNGFLVLLPVYIDSLDPTTYFRTAAAMAFLGGTIFEIGSYLMVVEALNRGRESNFGASLYHLAHSSSISSLDSHATTPPKSRDSSSDRTTTDSPGESNSPEESNENGKPSTGGWMKDGTEKQFVWWGKGLWHDIGYVAAYVQMWAATIFWISTLTGLPGVIKGFPDDPSVAITDVFFWTPQVIGGSGFMISSILLMLEVQTAWYKPALLDIGWHVGFWNLAGAVGFMLCGAFGYSPVERWVEQSAISTYWGSWSFLIGSIMQMYEVVWRDPAPKDGEEKK